VKSKPPPLSKKRPAPEIPTINNTSSSSSAVNVAAASAAGPSPEKRQRQQQQHPNRRVSLKAPVVMRDVTAFQKKHQVGEGTYGYVSLSFEGNGRYFIRMIISC
jgi:hypothetical protein